MADKQFINPNDFVGKLIPPEVLEQLKILGRIEFKPQPTVTSAVSKSESEKDKQTVDEESEINNLVNHVAEMEDLVKEIEDMIDDLLKDMAIPVDPNNKSLSKAVKSLDPNNDGSTITKEVLDKAMSILSHAPLLTNGYDPVLAALTGNGGIDGAFLNCNEIERTIAKTWKIKDQKKSFTPEEPIADNTAAIADEHEKNVGRMIIEMIQMLFFNMLWPKYLVDLAIINPTRTLVANPTDSIILFFKSFEAGSVKLGDSEIKYNKKPRFRVPDNNQLLALGPINKALNKIRCILMCIPPAKLWDIRKFDPMVDNFKCDCSKLLGECPEKEKKTVPESKGFADNMENIMNSIFSDDEPCFTDRDLIGDATPSKQDGLGIPPECLKHARVVMEAVIADALTPPSPSKAGISGTGKAAEQVKNQIGV